MSRLDEVAVKVSYLEGRAEGLTKNDRDQERRLQDLEEAEARRKKSALRRREAWSLFFRVVLPAAMVATFIVTTIYWRGIALGDWK